MLLHWALEHYELGNYIVLQKGVLSDNFQRRRSASLGSKRLFLDRILSALVPSGRHGIPLIKMSHILIDEYPLSLQQLVQIALASRHTLGMHHLMLYVMFDLRSLDPQMSHFADSYKASLHVPDSVWQHAYGFWQLDAALDNLADLRAANNAVHFLLLSYVPESGFGTDWDRHVLSLLAGMKCWDAAVAFARHMANSREMEDVETVLDILLGTKMYGQAYQYVSGMFKTEKVGTLDAGYRKVLESMCKLAVEKYHVAQVLFSYPFGRLEVSVIQEYLEKGLKSDNASLLLLFFHIQHNDPSAARTTYDQMITSNDPNVAFRSHSV